MESKGEIYQGKNQQSQFPSQSLQAEEDQQVNQSQAVASQKNINNDQNSSVNRLFSLGIVLLVVSVLISIFYLFSVSEVIENVTFELPNINLSF